MAEQSVSIKGIYSIASCRTFLYICRFFLPDLHKCLSILWEDLQDSVSS